MTTLGSLMQSYADVKSLNALEGCFQTEISGVQFYRAQHGNGRQPLLYNSGIIVMGQGRKEISIGDRQVCYGPGDYLVLGVPMPLECEAFAEPDSPILGVSVDVEPQVLHRLVNELFSDSGSREAQENRDRSGLDLGLYSQSSCERFNAVMERLMYVLHRDIEARLFGPAIVEELVYHVLNGPKGHILVDLARQDGHYARIARVLNGMHANFADNIAVEHLAEQANMSLSGFHRAFRQVTLETPLQYLKKIRLNKARELMGQGKRAHEVAGLVGYASASQFSREFKRYFNITPKSVVSA